MLSHSETFLDYTVRSHSSIPLPFFIFLLNICLHVIYYTVYLFVVCFLSVERKLQEHRGLRLFYKLLYTQQSSAWYKRCL